MDYAFAALPHILLLVKSPAIRWGVKLPCPLCGQARPPKTLYPRRHNVQFYLKRACSKSRHEPPPPNLTRIPRSARTLSGAWQKKINRKIHYFGRWGRRVNGKLERLPGEGWKEALALYEVQADDLHAERPRS